MSAFNRVSSSDRNPDTDVGMYDDDDDVDDDDGDDDNLYQDVSDLNIADNDVSSAKLAPAVQSVEKDTTLSLQHKELGNGLFKEKNYDGAIEEYSLAIGMNRFLTNSLICSLSYFFLNIRISLITTVCLFNQILCISSS